MSELIDARRLVLQDRYQDSLAIYAKLLADHPEDRILFNEMLAVKEHLVNLTIGNLTETNTLLMAKTLIHTLLQDPKYDDRLRLERYGTKVYSQNDEDGTIAEIFRRIGVAGEVGIFCEIGTEAGRECNTLHLLHVGWRGLWIEADSKHVMSLRRRMHQPIDDGQLSVTSAYATPETVNALLLELSEEIDLLSIDIDFNDYWLFNALTVRPRVVVIEYNGRFPPPTRRVVCYTPSGGWDGTDYFGCSLQALTDLANAKGYTLVGCNIIGTNAFFVRSDLWTAEQFFSPATAAALYQPPRYELHKAGGYRVGHSINAKSYGAWCNG